MTYSTGNTILASDYNSFANTGANNLSNIWGAGSSTAGWGQNATALAAVTTGSSSVTATQWAALVGNLQSACQQTNTAFTSRIQPVVGNTITILNNIQTDLNNVTAARGNANVAPTAVGVYTGSIAKLTPTGSGNAAWTITFTDTVTFANVAAARYFFNAGGQLKIMYGKSSVGFDSDADWNTFAGKCGNILISGNVNGNANIGGTVYTPTYRQNGSNVSVTQTALSTTTGFYNFTTANTQAFKLTDATATYTGDYIESNVKVDSNSTPSVITIVTTWFNAAVSGAGETRNITGGTDTPSPATSITGTAPTTLVNVLYPATTYIANTWGTVSVAGTVV
jgi:hypothetical protein